MSRLPMIVLYNPPSSANKKPILPMSLLAVGAVLEGHHGDDLDVLRKDRSLTRQAVAACEQAAQQDQAGDTPNRGRCRTHETTMFSSLSGTWITRRIDLPDRWAAIRSSDSAAATASSREAPRAS